MIDKDELKSFLRFLDTANDRELAERETLYRDMIAILPADSETRHDLQFLNRKLLEEKLTRINLQWLKDRRSAIQR